MVLALFPAIPFLFSGHVPRIEARPHCPVSRQKKNTQRATRRGAAAGANTAESLEPLLACRPLLAGQPVRSAQRALPQHAMEMEMAFL